MLFKSSQLPRILFETFYIIYVGSVTRELTFGTRPAVEVTQFRHPRSGFGAREKIILIKRRGKSMNQSWWKWFKLLFCFKLMKFIFVYSFINGNGRQNRFSGAKTGLLRRAGARTLFPGNTHNVASGAGVILQCNECHTTHAYTN